MEFDRHYYESIWGSVHRHDYCHYWGQRILHDYGRGARVLDAGTGCGFLVKTLRDLGLDAWGIDSSDYAIANTCAPGYVLKASVTDIPFRDDSFDLVFSNGLWEYLTIDEISKGRDEIWRVGSRQLHNIDHDKCDYRDDFVTWKSLEWWDEQLAAPKVLISCPTYEPKKYAHQAWIDAVKAIDYPNFEIFVVDNSPTPDCYNRWKDKISMAWLGDHNSSFLLHPSSFDAAQRMAHSMEIARQKFLAGNYRWWLNLEIDIIPEPSILKTLIRLGKGADWTAHCYPARGETEQCCSGMGCSLWSRRLIEDFLFAGAGDHLNQGVDAYFWNWVRPKAQYKTIELWSHVPIQHLKEPNS